MQTEQLNRERVLLDEKNKIACEGHPNVDATTGGTGSRGASGYTGTGSGTSATSATPNTSATAGSGYGTGAHSSTGAGLGQGSGATTGGSTYGSGTGVGTGSGTPLSPSLPFLLSLLLSINYEYPGNVLGQGIHLIYKISSASLPLFCPPKTVFLQQDIHDALMQDMVGLRLAQALQDRTQQQGCLPPRRWASPFLSLPSFLSSTLSGPKAKLQIKIAQKENEHKANMH